jgi:hypothetical protein
LCACWVAGISRRPGATWVSADAAVGRAAPAAMPSLATPPTHWWRPGPLTGLEQGGRAAAHRVTWTRPEGAREAALCPRAAHAGRFGGGAFTGDQGRRPHARHQRRRPGAQGRTPFPAGSATTSVGPWLGSHCGAGSGFTPTSSATRTASGPQVWTTRSAGGAGSARAPHSGTRRGSSPGDVLGCRGGGGS